MYVPGISIHNVILETLRYRCGLITKVRKHILVFRYVIFRESTSISHGSIWIHTKLETDYYWALQRVALWKSLVEERTLGRILQRWRWSTRASCARSCGRQKLSEARQGRATSTTVGTWSADLLCRFGEKKIITRKFWRWTTFCNAERSERDRNVRSERTVIQTLLGSFSTV